MCKSDRERAHAMPTYTWDEVRKHTTKDDTWIVIDGLVYDVTKWKYKHPGGQKMLTNQAGQDSTVRSMFTWVTCLLGGSFNGVVDRARD